MRGNLRAFPKNGSRWWQLKYVVIFTPTWGNDPIWLIFFKWDQLEDLASIGLCFFFGWNLGRRIFYIWDSSWFTKLGSKFVPFGASPLNFVNPLLNVFLRENNPLDPKKWNWCSAESAETLLQLIKYQKLALGPSDFSWMSFWSNLFQKDVYKHKDIRWKDKKTHLLWKG